jgi:DNA-binding transcriptional regulator YhcF (GntR family)
LSTAGDGLTADVAAVEAPPGPSDTATAPVGPAHDEPLDVRRPVESLIRLTGSESTPVYIQLADQLRYLIRTGELQLGSRLPTARHLAQNLRINRNTVMSAYSMLSRDGYVRGNRRGGTQVIRTHLADEPATVSLDARLMALADELVTAAAQLGLAPAEIGSLVEAHARLRRRESDLRVCFVECNPASLFYFVGELDREFGLTIVPALLQDLTPGGTLDLAGLDCVISTFYHLSEVRRLLRAMNVSIEFFAIAVRPHLSVVEALEDLPPGSSVGVAYASTGDDRTAMEHRLLRMTEAVEHTKVRGLKVRPILVGSRPTAALFDGLDAIVVRPENIAAVRSAIPAPVRVIEFVNVLDSSSKHFLREVFADLTARPRDAKVRRNVSVRSEITSPDERTPRI